MNTMKRTDSAGAFHSVHQRSGVEDGCRQQYHLPGVAYFCAAVEVVETRSLVARQKKEEVTADVPTLLRNQQRDSELLSSTRYLI